jgi:hypothetical protein
MIRLILRWISAVLIPFEPLLLLLEPGGAEDGEGLGVAEDSKCEIICCSSAKISINVLEMNIARLVDDAEDDGLYDGE